MRNGALPAQPAPAPRRGEEYLTEQQQAILEVLEGSDRALALREIRSGLASPTNDRRLREDLAILKDHGLAAPSGHGRGARWKPS